MIVTITSCSLAITLLHQRYHNLLKAKDRKLSFPAPENKSKMLRTGGCERWGIKMRVWWSVDLLELCYSSSGKSKSREWVFWCHFSLWHANSKWIPDWWATSDIRLIHCGIIAPDALSRPSHSFRLSSQAACAAGGPSVGSGVAWGLGI